MFHVKRFSVNPKLFHVKQGENMKKLTVFLLIAVVLALSACENVEYPNESIVPPDVSIPTVYEELEQELPDVKEYDGQVFTVVTNNTSLFYSSETESGAISAAVRKRNDFIAEKYGVTVTAVELNEDTLRDNLENAKQSGLAYCDMLSLPAELTVSLMMDGLLYDIGSLEGFDPTEKYYSGIATSLATGNKLYMLPDPVAIEYGGVKAMFFNRELVAKYCSESPESLANQGKWTWDTMLEMSRTVASKVNSSTSSDINLDNFGYGSGITDEALVLTMWVSADKPILGDTYKVPVTFVLGTSAGSDLCKELRDIYNVRVRYPISETSAAQAFSDGRLGFLVEDLSFIAAIRDGSAKGSEFGILPIPKLDAAQNGYSCYADGKTGVLSVPSVISDPGKVSTIMKAVTALGSETAKSAYASEFLTRYLINNTETVMLSLILDSVKFDLSLLLANENSSAKTVSYSAITAGIINGTPYWSTASGRVDNFEKFLSENFG